MANISEKSATLIGAGAILLWALLAWLTASTGDVPPFALVAITFGIAFILWLGRFAFMCLRRGTAAFLIFRQAWPIWALGIGGLFLYHAFYFIALDHAPPIDASLIAYLWPLLIVIFSGLLPGEKIRLWHILGALMGFAGAALLIAGKGELSLAGEYKLGYFFAFLCAFTWSGYSVLSRLVGKVPSDVIGPCCGATALLGLFAHLLFEPDIPSLNSGQYWAILGLGLGPVGLAFFVWDMGVKRGNIVMLGTLSYFSPLLSSAILIIAGRADFSMNLILCALLITMGALFAAQGAAIFRLTSSIKRVNK